jgi:hypothetical protein
MAKAYCGGCNQHLKVPDNFTAPRGRCPHCGELVVNPQGELSKKNLEYYQKDRLFLEQFFEIRYDELTLFLLSSALLITALVNIDVIAEWCAQLRGISLLKIGFVVLSGAFFGLAYIIGFLLSLYHIFTKRLKSENEQAFMICFAVVTNFLSGIAAAFYMYVESVWQDKWYLAIFPVWVFLNSLFLLLKFHNYTHLKFDDVITEENASPAQVISGLIVLWVVFGLCHFVFKLNWAITLSISVAYSTGLSKAFRELIPIKIPMADKTGEQ